MSGGLYDPLGAGTPTAPPRWRPSGLLVAAGLFAVAVALVGLVVALRGGDERGEPHAIVTIDRPPPTVALPVAPAPPSPPTSAAAAPSIPSARDADVEIQNGVRIIRMHPEPSRPAGQAAPVPPIATNGPQGTRLFVPPSPAH